MRSYDLEWTEAVSPRRCERHARTSGIGGAGIVDAGGNGVYTGGTYCCSGSCGICAALGELCTAQFCGSDASAPAGARHGCMAVPSLDGTNCGGTRALHFYGCQRFDLPAPCVLVGIGNVTGTFCCP